MLSATNLTEQVGKWHRRMEAQYRKADAANDIRAAATVARTALAAIETFAKLMLAAQASAVAVDADADQPAVVMPEYSLDDLREIAQALIESGGLTTLLPAAGVRSVAGGGVVDSDPEPESDESANGSAVHLPESSPTTALNQQRKDATDYGHDNTAAS